MRYVINKAKRTKEKPDFVTTDDWIELTKTWKTEKHKRRCEQNRKNRASSSNEGSATYAGSFINIGEHKKIMVSLINML